MNSGDVSGGNSGGIGEIICVIDGAGDTDDDDDGNCVGDDIGGFSFIGDMVD